MEITFLRTQFSLGASGGSSYSLDLTARLLSERGHDVTVGTLDIMSLGDGPEDLPYVVKEIGTKKSPLSNVRQLVNYMRSSESQTEIYHIYGPGYLPAGGLYNQISGTNPVVGRLNGYAFCSNLNMMNAECHKNCTFWKKMRHSPKDKVSKALSAPMYLFNAQGYHRLTNSVDCLLALSPAVHRRYEENGIDRDLMKIIPNCYDPSFMANSDSSRGANTDTLRIIYVGRLSEFKGVQFLIQSINECQMTDVEVDIVGDGPQQEHLKKMVKANSLENQVTFHGHVTHWDLPKLYQAADIFVHPGTLPEPLNRTVLEAMQHEAVPVVSDIGAPPWVVGDAGKTFTPGDSTELARCLDELSDPDSRQELANRCEERLESFSPGRICGLLEETYFNLIK